MLSKIGPKVTVRDVVPKLLEPKGFDFGNQKTILMEVICNGEMQRPLHLKEFLLPTILKWADWSEEERKDNQLVFRTHSIIQKLLDADRVKKIDLILLYTQVLYVSYLFLTEFRLKIGI